MKIEVKKSQISGNGVFATTQILKDELIEVSNLIILEHNEIKFIDKTKLYNYYFSWPNNTAALALGFGSIYNHSYTPNCKYKKDLKNKTLGFYAIKKIKKGDEILVNYNGNPNCTEKVWFDK